MPEPASDIRTFITGRTRHDLNRDRMLLLALVRALEIIGEAANHLSPTVRSEAPELAWPAVIGMRNRIVHAYFNVDADIVWKAATEEVPALIPHLRSLLGRSEGDE